MEAQDGGSIGRLRSLDCCGWQNNNMNVNGRLGEVRLEGEEHNMIVSLKFSMVKCIKGNYDEGFVGQVRDFVPI